MYSGQTGWVAEYDRQIKYLDYMENGQRSRGAGFLKLERRGDICNISLQVSGLYRKDHFTRPFLLIGDGQEQELCRLQLADGGIKTYFEGLDSHSLDGQGLRYEQLQGIRIPISEGKEIRCLWGKAQEARDSAVKPEVETESDAEIRREPEMNAEVGREPEISGKANQGPEMNAEVRRESGTGWKDISVIKLESEPELESGSEPKPEAKPSDVSGFQSREMQAVDGIQAAFKEDKWSQLCAIYPHICPFSDEREYLSFGLSDFVVLSGQSYKLVNNSFLLHGFYTHRYLILTRVVQRGNARYYIGVPGHLFDKEKRTAIMFGFEGFECESEPASEGDFGFYLVPVDI